LLLLRGGRRGAIHMEQHNLRTPVLPLHLPSTSSCLSFTSLLSARITRALEGEQERSVCVVLTNGLLGLFHCPRHPSTAPTHQPQSQPHDLGSVTVQNQGLTLQTLVDNLEPDLILPYDQLDSLLFYIPDTCLCLKLPSSPSGGPSTPQQLLHLLFTSWEMEENQSCVKGGYAAHLVETAMLSSQTSQRTTSSTNPTLTPTKTSTNPDTFTLQTLTNPLLSDILSHVVPGGQRLLLLCLLCPVLDPAPSLCAKGGLQSSVPGNHRRWTVR
uniref:uncharacterized protein LOC124030024 n=1 Tax=Oncorhynchus gorbuscha TaxID=8017 RepID=UPI001EAF3C3F